jgi:hypothetical protein
MDMDTSEVTPDVLLPVRLATGNSRARVCSQKRLQLAVLVDALRIRVGPNRLRDPSSSPRLRSGSARGRRRRTVLVRDLNR